MPKPYIIKFAADEELKAQLERLAAERHISLSALIRLALSTYLRQKGAHASH